MCFPTRYVLSASATSRRILTEQNLQDHAPLRVRINARRRAKIGQCRVLNIMFSLPLRGARRFAQRVSHSSSPSAIQGVVTRSMVRTLRPLICLREKITEVGEY